MADIAAAHGATSAQVALAWLLGRGEMVVPIPGTKRTGYVEDNAGAPEVSLTDDDLERLDGLAGEVSGDRYGSAAATPTWVSPALK